jgi:hypothetical protein
MDHCLPGEKVFEDVPNDTTASKNSRSRDGDRGAVPPRKPSYRCTFITSDDEILPRDHRRSNATA